MLQTTKKGEIFEISCFLFEFCEKKSRKSEKSEILGPFSDFSDFGSASIRKSAKKAAK
jgi:hypothetical protein